MDNVYVVVGRTYEAAMVKKIQGIKDNMTIQEPTKYFCMGRTKLVDNRISIGCLFLQVQHQNYRFSLPDQEISGLNYLLSDTYD